MTINVLFVCLGNICRSPTAEGVFHRLVNNAGLTQSIQIDSAGTANWHQGKAPDSRTIAAAKKRDVDLSVLCARTFTLNDFDEFDYILAMDNENLAILQHLKPKNFKGYLGLILTFGAQSQYSEVPDPYHGDNQGFELVLDLIEDAAAGLLTSIQNTKLI